MDKLTLKTLKTLKELAKLGLLCYSNYLGGIISMVSSPEIKEILKKIRSYLDKNQEILELLDQVFEANLQEVVDKYKDIDSEKTHEHK